MSGPDLVIVGQILTPSGMAPGYVEVTSGVITAVEPDAVERRPPEEQPRGAAPPRSGQLLVRLAADEVLLPGLVDTHVHVNEPGRTEWEGFATATRAAAAGGVTTLVDMPLNSLPPTTTVEALRCKQQAAVGQCSVDVGFWGGAVPDSLGRLAELHQAGVFGFKCFLLDSGVPEFPPLSAEQLRAAMTEMAAFDGLLLVHAEDPEVIAAHPCPRTVHYREFLDSRPPRAETAAIDAVIAAARATGCRTHVVHLSSAAALPAIAAAKADGVRLTVETCPHYLTLAAEDVADGQTQFKCCPPVRERGNAELLWQALGEGTIDFVVSDHSPSPPELKLLGEGDFGGAWGGISSLQLGLPLVWTEARRRGHPLAEVLQWTSERPAELVGVPGKGRISVGAAADFAVFAPEQELVVDGAILRHRHPLSPYDGRHLTGLVRDTYLAGRRLDLDAMPQGRLLSSAPAPR